jgi:cytochrome c
MPAGRRAPSVFRSAAWSTIALVLACGETSSPPVSPTTGGGASSGGDASSGGSASYGGSTSSGGVVVAGESFAGSTAGQSGASGTSSGGVGGGGNANSGAAGAGGGGSASDAGSATSAGVGATDVGGGAAVAGGSGTSAGTSSGGAPPIAPPRVLVFSHTAGFRHDSIPAGIAALSALAVERHWTLDATEDPAFFTEAALAPYDVVVFLSTSGDVFNAEQQAAFERFIRTPNPTKGFVGIHGASTTEYAWPFYLELVGAYFREHPPDLQSAVVVVEAEHPATAPLPARWTLTDEWYAFRQNPRPEVTVLLTLDESTYTPGTATMSGDHPIAWSHTNVGARSFYTALGHTPESYADPLFLEHLARAIEWSAGR